jgi:hypothetical protein
MESDTLPARCQPIKIQTDPLPPRLESTSDSPTDPHVPNFGATMIRDSIFRFVCVTGFVTFLFCVCTPESAHCAGPSSTVSANETINKLSEQQQWWRTATEAKGEEGARWYAKSMGWTPICDGRSSTLPQGLDQVYRSSDGVVHVIEAKGGSSALGNGYGYKQASTEWAIKAAERTFKFEKASLAELDAAHAVLSAGTQPGRLAVHVVHTSNATGEAGIPVCEQTVVAGKESARLAKAVNADLEPLFKTFSIGGKESIEGLSPRNATGLSTEASAVEHGVETAAGSFATGAKCLKFAGEAALPIVLGADVVVHIHEGQAIDRQYRNGILTVDQRDSAQIKNVCGGLGAWTGVWAGAKLGGAGGAVIGSFIPGIGTTAGAFIGSFGGSIVGYAGGEAAAEAIADHGASWLHQHRIYLSEIVAAKWEAAKVEYASARQTCLTACDSSCVSAQRITRATVAKCSSAYDSAANTCSDLYDSTTNRAHNAWVWPTN